MGYSRWDKIINWICKKFGHKCGDSWVFNGETRCVCKRCKVVYKEDRPGH